MCIQFQMIIVEFLINTGKLLSINYISYIKPWLLFLFLQWKEQYMGHELAKKNYI
jgi:hypothetical protein